MSIEVKNGESVFEVIQVANGYVIQTKDKTFVAVTVEDLKNAVELVMKDDGALPVTPQS